jgi:hypothetical protein
MGVRLERPNPIHKILNVIEYLSESKEVLEVGLNCGLKKKCGARPQIYPRFALTDRLAIYNRTQDRRDQSRLERNKIV